MLQIRVPTTSGIAAVASVLFDDKCEFSLRFGATKATFDHRTPSSGGSQLVANHPGNGTWFNVKLVLLANQPDSGPLLVRAHVLIDGQESLSPAETQTTCLSTAFNEVVPAIEIGSQSPYDPAVYIDNVVFDGK